MVSRSWLKYKEATSANYRQHVMIERFDGKQKKMVLMRVILTTHM
jgi:hypothetical protein